MFGGHHYKLFGPENISWSQARDKCKALGGHLVTITSSEENEFILSLLSNDRNCWIGAEEVYLSGKWTNAYKWSTGEKFSFSYWHYGAPSRDENNYGYHHAGFSYALYGNEANRCWRWDNLRYREDSVFDYICEWDF